MSTAFKRVSIGLVVLLLLTLIILFFLYYLAPAEYEEPFDGNGLPSGWKVETGNLPGDWAWTPDGTASGGQYYGQRGAIQSESLGGAAVFNADALSAGDTTRFFTSSLVSPVIRSTFRQERTYLSFYTYYRRFKGQATVEVYGDTNDNLFADSWVRVDTLPPAVFSFDQVSPNQETDPGARMIYDITDLVSGKVQVKVRFTFADSLYFWIIDDVRLGDYTETFEGIERSPGSYDPTIAEVLGYTGTPAITDGQGGYFPPDQLVVYWEADADGQIPSIPERDAIRESLNFDLSARCPCDPLLEEWRFRYPDDVDRSVEDPIELFGLKDGATAETKSMTDFNYYNKTWGNTDTSTYVYPGDPLFTVPRLPDHDPTAVLVAILDTGMEYYEVDVMRYLWRTDDDSNCMGNNDRIGWNFVANDNAPIDDHPGKHGSNVSRVVLREMLEGDYNFRLMPVKTHDERGISSLYEVTCATYYAIAQGADVINMSWGWYGSSNQVLREAIRQAGLQNITVVTAAGNSGRVLGQDTLLYPAMYEGLSNLLTVGAMEWDSTSGNWVVSSFSNTSSEFVDVSAQGTGVYVLGTKMPAPSEELEELLVADNDILGLAMLINGTSFAAPFIAATAAKARQKDPGTNPWENVRVCAESAPPEKRLPTDAVHNGARITPDDACGF